LKRTPLTPGLVHPFEVVVGNLLAHESDALGLAVRGIKRVTIARLSLAWQEACTITFLSKPRKSRQREQLLLGASQGVYLRSGA